MIQTNKAFFIKLGKEGGWEESCITKDNTIKLGFVNPLHEKCLNGDWEVVKRYWADKGKTVSKAAQITNQIRIFYESDEETLWITFWQKKMYWCFAGTEISILNDGTRIRKVKGSWSCLDFADNTMFTENVSGQVSKVQGFRGTICKIQDVAYLVNRINSKKSVHLTEAEMKYKEVIKSMIPLIKNLYWKDFELLVDLVFTSSGWQRLSIVGKTEKDLDLELIQIVTDERAFVQIKSKSNKKIFEKSIKSFREKIQFNKMYYVVHSPDDDLENWEGDSDIKLLTAEKLAKLVINLGLGNWLLRKSN